MVICEQCGTRVLDGRRFCEVCGAYLEWDGTRAAGRPTAGSPTPAQTEIRRHPEATSAPDPVLEQPVASHPAERVEASAPDATAPPGRAPRHAAADDEPHHAPPLSTSDTTTIADPSHQDLRTNGAVADALTQVRTTVADSDFTRSAALLMPRATDPVLPDTDDGQPEAVKPGERVKARPQVRQWVDEPAPGPGDLICGMCGAGNRPSRRFCRRCAASLEDAEAVPPPPTWRRLFTGRTAPPAGYRRRRRRIRRPRWLVPLTVVLALVCTAFLARGHIQAGVELVRDKLVTPRQIHPVAGSERASSAAKDTPARLAFDGTTDLFWTPNHPGAATGEFLEINFDHPFRLVELHIFAGASTNEQYFLTQGRPRELQVAATSHDGTTTTENEHLADTPGEQVFPMRVSEVTHIRLTVGSDSYGPKDRPVAIAEVAFFERP